MVPYVFQLGLCHHQLLPAKYVGDKNKIATATVEEFYLQTLPSDRQLQ